MTSVVSSQMQHVNKVYWNLYGGIPPMQQASLG